MSGSIAERVWSAFLRLGRGALQLAYFECLAVGEGIWVGFYDDLTAVQARFDLCARAVVEAELDRPAHGLSVLDADAEGLVIVLHDRRERQGQYVGMFLNDDRRVGVQTGAQDAVVAGQVDLGAQGARGRVERPGRSRHRAFEPAAGDCLETY